MVFNLRLLKKIAFTDFATDYSTGGFLYPPYFIWRSVNNFSQIRRLIARSLKKSPFEIAMYAHFPFCASRCSFCRFYALANRNPDNYDQVLSCMIKELGIWADLIRRSRKIRGKIPLQSIYLGGGTPTLFDLRKFFEAFFKNYNIQTRGQINLESTPVALDEKKLLLYKKIGVSRLLIGVQSLDPHVLKTINRFPEQSLILEKVFRQAKNIGIPNVTFELMAGLPGQSRKSFLGDLSKLIKLRPDGIHIYLFLSSPLSTLGKMGYAHDLKARQFFKAGVRNLKKAGYVAKGDEWILPNKEAARNFQQAFSRPNVITIGPSANGGIRTVDANLAFCNIFDVEEYQKQIKKNNLVAASYFILKGKEELIRQRLIAKMRFRQIENLSEFKMFKKEFDFLKKHGCIKIGKRGIKTFPGKYGDYFLYPRLFYSPKIIKKCEKIMKTKYSSIFRQKQG